MFDDIHLFSLELCTCLNVPAIFACPADNVLPDYWQPRRSIQILLLGMVEARSVKANNTHTHTHEQRSERVDGRRSSAINRTRVVATMWETGGTWVGREKSVDKKELVQKLPTQIIKRIENIKGAWGEAQAIIATQGLSENCTGRESVIE